LPAPSVSRQADAGYRTRPVEWGEKTKNFQGGEKRSPFPETGGSGRKHRPRKPAQLADIQKNEPAKDAGRGVWTGYFFKNGGGGGS